jgi:PIN domain nuclease of toxin-antitoxin system
VEQAGRAIERRCATLIAEPGNQVYISAASLWEIAIKRRLRKLGFRGSAAAAIGAGDFHELPILPIDAAAAGALPWRHNNPFDRMLVTQARRMTLALATADAVVRACGGVALLWAG